MTDRQMKDIYNANDASRGHYMIGSHESGRVMVYVCNAFHFIELATCDCSSKKSGSGSTCLRYRQTARALATIREHASEVIDLCSVDYLERVAKAYGKRANRGKALEKILTEYFGQTWVDDNLEWWLGSDLVVNGQGYQVKYDRCNFTSEEQILKNGLEG